MPVPARSFREDNLIGLAALPILLPIFACVIELKYVDMPPRGCPNCVLTRAEEFIIVRDDIATVESCTVVCALWDGNVVSFSFHAMRTFCLGIEGIANVDDDDSKDTAHLLSNGVHLLGEFSGFGFNFSREDFSLDLLYFSSDLILIISLFCFIESLFCFLDSSWFIFELDPLLIECG